MLTGNGKKTKTVKTVKAVKAVKAVVTMKAVKTMADEWESVKEVASFYTRKDSLSG